MAGIYIHIPFCKQACSYCDFYFSTHLLDKQQFITTLFNEIKNRKTYLGKNTISTIYFGGGTPSQLSTEELDCILKEIFSNFNVNPNVEITVEANPDNLTIRYLTQLYAIGINRLSIGIQSFNDDDLKLMQRAHSVQDAYDCVKKSKNVGFNNISIDLIYGLPNNSLLDWKKNVEKAIELKTQHISAYNLTIEKGTPLAHSVAKGRIKIPFDDTVVSQHDLMVDLLRKAGFEHYETSNFAKKGYRSAHNSSYWKGDYYLGLGPSAHSYNGTSRSWNISNTKKYIERIKKGSPYFETEELTTVNQINEYILTSLRTSEGISLPKFEELFGENKRQKLVSDSLTAQANQNLTLTNNRLKVTERGKMLIDGIISDLFFE